MVLSADVALLIIEDEPRVRAFLARGLTEEGFVVEQAEDGPGGLALAQSRKFELILLDWLLPGLSGLELLRTLRGRGDTTPIIVLTAHDSLENRLEALNSGADDFVPKPYNFEEVLARSRALLRRAAVRQSPVLTCADLTVDLVARRVVRAGQEVRLTAREFALLQHLMERQGEPQSRIDIVESVWEHDVETFSNVVDVYIRHLRQKIDAPFGRPLIHTVRGTGYVLKVEP
jgi:two-component system copper resistance phosphate regulon response regulator CusR